MPSPHGHMDPKNSIFLRSNFEKRLTLITPISSFNTVNSFEIDDYMEEANSFSTDDVPEDDLSILNWSQFQRELKDRYNIIKTGCSEGIIASYNLYGFDRVHVKRGFH